MTDAAVVFGGDAFSKGLAFVTSIIVMKLAVPEQMGVFSLFLAMQNILFQVTDLGLTLSLVNSIAANHADRPRALSFLKAGFIAKMALLLVVAVPLGLLSPVIFDWIGSRSWIDPFRFACLAALGMGLFSFVASYYQGFQRFTSFSALKLGEGVLRAGAIILLVLLSGFHLRGVMAAYALAPLVVAAIAIIGPLRAMRAVGWGRREMAALARTSKWIMISVVATGLALQMDVLMLGWLSTTKVVGEYGAALRIAVPYQIASNALVTVLLPKIRNRTDPKEIWAFFVRSTRTTVPIAFVACAAGIFAAPFIFRFFPQYGAAVGLFRILSVGLGMSIILAPAGVLLYALERLDLFAWISMGQLAFAFVANLAVIPRFGAEGAAVNTGILWIGFGIANIIVARRIIARATPQWGRSPGPNLAGPAGR
jgi:O-antigen/teichoic acid export membrane protein